MLRAKLAPAPRARQHIDRPHLVRALASCTDRRLTVVAAPPGFGKTTLLAEFHAAASDGMAVAWVALDREDNDPGRIWAHIQAAIAGVVSAQSGGQRSGRSSATGLAPLLNAASGFDHRVVLVLDDYHLVSEPAVHDMVAFLVEHLPPALRVVIATRHDPPLPLARLRACGDLGELRAEHLRFTPDEAGVVLATACDAALTPSDVRRLHEKTDGWPAALYLAALSLRGRDEARPFVDSFSGSNRHVVDYLASEVLAGEDPATIDFLLRTSLLDRLCGPLCDAVMGGAGSTERLRTLERSNLLVIPLDDDRLWFRYSTLFRDMLRFRLSELDPDAVALVHERAGAWLEEHHDTRGAVEHALAAGRQDRAGRLIGRTWCRLVSHGHAPIIDEWLEGLPQALVLADPGLCLMRAVVEESRGAPRAEVERWLTAAERNESTACGDPGPLPLGTDSVLLEAALVRAAGGGQDVGALVATARRAHELAEDRGPLARALASTYLGYWLLLAGRHEDARAFAVDAIRLDASRTVPLVGAVQHAVASLAAGALGEDGPAAELAAIAVDRVRAHGHEHTPQASLVFLAHGRVRARRGAAREAEREFRRAIALAVGPALSLERAHALLSLAGVTRQRGDVAGAARMTAEARRLVAAAADPGELRRIVGQSPPPAPVVDGISDAEIRVLRLLPSDLTFRQIGERLFVSINTVKSHVRSLYRTLDVSSREAAVARARDLRLL